MKSEHTPSLAILLACSFAFVIVQLDVTIVNVALPKMGAELGASVSALQWVVDAYTLGFAVLLLSTAGWRSIFWVNVPICIAGFALTCVVVPQMASKEPAKHFDLPGQLLSVLALAGFIGAVIEVQALGFSSALVQGGFILAFVA